MPKILLLLTLSLILVVAAVGSSQNYQSQQRVLGAETERELEIAKVKNDISHWERIVSHSPTYRDAYVQLAILNYQLSEIDKAKAYLQKALEIDPNWIVPTPLVALLPS